MTFSSSIAVLPQLLCSINYEIIVYPHHYKILIDESVSMGYVFDPTFRASTDVLHILLNNKN